MNDNIAIRTYIGTWIDKVGKQIEIYEDKNRNIFADITINEHPFETKMLNGESKDTIKLKAEYDTSTKALIVELTEPGVGAFLSLEYEEVNNSVALKPTLYHGLYDEYEEGFGASWILPLHYFIKRTY